MSLLKSPKNPDRNCDMHKHYIYYAVLPHKGSFQEDGVIQKAYELNILGANNVPLVPAGTTFPSNFVVSSNPGVFVEAVKVSKVTSTTTNTICIRIYEGFGGVASTKLDF
jgi:alpha-mannosidase